MRWRRTRRVGRHAAGSPPRPLVASPPTAAPEADCDAVLTRDAPILPSPGQSPGEQHPQPPTSTVRLGFSDGSEVELDTASRESRALRAVADVLTSRQGDERIGR